MTYTFHAGLSKEKLDTIRGKLEKHSTSFSNKKYLDSLSLPSGIIGRENEAMRILQNLYEMKKGYAVPFISVYGRSGTGKSSVVGFLCENISDVACTAFVNLRRSKTIFNCANAMLSELGAVPLKSADGMSRALDMIEKRIVEILVSEKKKFFVLTLDEFDVIFQDKRSDPSDFVFKLLTLAENLRKKDLWLCVISISNNSLVGYDLEDRVRSRMGREEVFFAPYEKSEILKILQDRASFGPEGMISDDILGICAEKSSIEHGDCRRAIDLLRTAVEIAGPSKVTEEHVNKAEKYLGRDNLKITIDYATPHQRMILAALCVLALNSGKSYHATSRIISQYEMSLMGTKTAPLSYRRLFDLMADLEGSGLVVRKTRSRGRYGYASEWALSTDENMVGNALNPEWWENKRIEKHSFEEFKERSRRRWEARKKGIIC